MLHGFIASSTIACRRPLISSSVYRSSHIRRSTYMMSAQTNGVVPAGQSSEGRKLKILMLHGYTQSGSLFHAKTRGLEKLLMKAFPASSPAIKRSPSPLATTYPGGVQLFYPTAPMRLLPADIPGYRAPEDEETSPSPDAWGWFRRETGGAKYIGLEEGLSTIADAIREAGGVDGVIGFSQGAAAAAFVASLLEPGRADAFARRHAANPEAIEFSDSFARLVKETGQGALKFAVSYSGFLAPNPDYKAFYEPKIQTSFLHVIGSLDSVVEGSRSMALLDACLEEKAKVLYHPGGHFVPVGKDITGALVSFIRECCGERKEEPEIEDIDIPF